MSIIGKVLWWDRRDQEGIIVDGTGNQFYFNYSVLSKAVLNKLRDGLLVEFEKLETVQRPSCAHEIKLVSARAEKRANRKFTDQRHLSVGGA